MTARTRVGAMIPVLEGEQARAWVEGRARGGPGGADPDRVREILERVRREGDAALLALGEELDGVRPASLRVPSGTCHAALEEVSPERRRALERAARNIARFHEAQRRPAEAPLEVEPGVRAWREFRPIERVGVYVPGGRAAYPSTVLMTAVPARLAGCRQVVLCSPPGPDGLPHASVMAAAALAGVDTLFAAGGAQAIAAMAYGTETVPAVDKVFGPGNAWVSAAKTALAGVVEVDMPAGPSEVVVWADAAAPPVRVAAELLAQAEHGPDSLCVALLPDGEAAGAVRAALEAALPGLARREPAAASLSRSALLVCPDPEEAARLVDGLAPEHLAILTREPRRDAARVSAAASVFLGPWAPVAAGDYAAGPNHVLPTGRRARGRGGLALDDFGRWIQLQELDRQGLERLAGTVVTLAEWEGLPAHAASVRARLAEDGRDRGAQDRGESHAEHRAAGAVDAGARGFDPSTLVRAHLRHARPYVTARSQHAGGILLDANEHGLGTLVPELSPDLHRYPDPRTPALRAALAGRLGVHPDALWIGNGSDEAIDLLVRALAAPGEAVVMATPSYGVYEARTEAHGARAVPVRLDGGFDLEPGRTAEAVRRERARLVLLCSPNNPTGNRLSEDRILALAGSVPALVAVDEAYVEFSPRPSLAARTAEVPNLVVLRTFSKAWGLAGARVGWLVADPRLVRLLDAAGLPYPVSSPAATAALRALERAGEMEERRDRIVAERERMAGGLADLGLRVLPSEANFLLFFVSDAVGVQRALAREAGVVVRDRSGLPGLEGALRVSVGAPRENDRFLEALEAALRDGDVRARAPGEGGRAPCR